MGNPNCGKSTLFNALTGGNATVGNWPGVTVEQHTGVLTLGDTKKNLVDLPGLYSLQGYGAEEQVSCSFVADCELILCVISATALPRGLYLALQLCALGKPMVVALSMMDELKKSGGSVNVDTLQNLLDTRVVPIHAKSGMGLKELAVALQNAKVPVRECKDEPWKEIESVVTACYTPPKNLYRQSDKIDKVALGRSGRWLFAMICSVLLGALFLLGEAFVGKFVKLFLDWLCGGVLAVMKYFGAPTWSTLLIEDGVFAGMGNVLLFLPSIFLLYLALALLEDSGYLARGVFLLDGTMRKIGLTGQSFIPLIMGLGCSVPAFMGCATLPAGKTRSKTAFLCGYVCCSAKLPSLLLLSGVLFGQNALVVLMGVYLLSLLVLCLVGGLVYSKDSRHVFIELPPYRLPAISSLLKSTLGKCKDFLYRVGTLVLCSSVCVWFLLHFNTAFLPCKPEDSLLALGGKFASGLFAPLGFASWQWVVLLLLGLFAKELIVSGYGVICGVGMPAIGLGGAVAYLCFVMLYPPCFSAFLAERQQIGTVCACGHFMARLAIAYVVALAANCLVGVFTFL